MTNEQIVETKKWNKLSIVAFCLSFIFNAPALLIFIPIAFGNVFDIYWKNQEAVFLIDIALFIFSIIAIVKARKLNQKGVYLGVISLVLSILPIGLLIFGALALSAVLNMG